MEPFGVTGFPTLLYFENGEFQYKYEGTGINEPNCVIDWAALESNWIGRIVASVDPWLGPRTRKAIVDFMMNPSPNFKGPKQDVEKKQDEMLVGIPDEVYVLNSANFEDFVDSNPKDRG